MPPRGRAAERRGDRRLHGHLSLARVRLRRAGRQRAQRARERAAADLSGGHRRGDRSHRREDSMIGNIISLLVIVLLTALFAWLFSRALRARSLRVKAPGLILAGLLTLVCAAAAVVALIGLVELEGRHANPVADLKIAGTPEQLARRTARLGLRRLPRAGAGAAAQRRHRKLPGGRAASGRPVRIQPDACRTAARVEGRRDRARDS